MDQEITRQIRTLTELTVENNRILHSLQRTQRWANFFSWVKWAIIIAVTVGSYIVVQPYLDDMVKNYDGIKKLISTSPSTSKGIPSIDEIRKLLSPTVNSQTVPAVPGQIH
jgi:hypothetical protein